MTNVISAVYDVTGNELYRGRDEDEVKLAARSVEGTTYWRLYHRVGDSVCVNEFTYRNGERTGHSQRYIRGSEIELLAGVLDGRLV